MPQVKTGIATTILAPDSTGEDFVEISSNKTLFIQKLTYNDAFKPEIIEGLQKIEDAFGHFKPNMDVEFEKEDGSFVENFQFNNLDDFDLKNLIDTSPYLKNLNLENDAYLTITKQIRTNRALPLVIEKDVAKAAFIDSLKSLLHELDTNGDL